MKSPIQCQVKKTWWFWLIIENQELKAFLISWTWCFPGLLFLLTGAVAEARLMRKPDLFYHFQILMPAASSGAYCELRLWLENSLGWFMGNIIIFFFSVLQLTGLLISKLINWTYLSVFSQKCLSCMIPLHALFFLQTAIISDLEV